MIALARKTLIHEWRRFLPVVLAVAFSGVMLLVQAALVLGIFGSASLYVTASSADLWVGYPGTQSVNFGRPVDRDAEMLMRLDPAVRDVEPYLWVDGDWLAEGQNGSGISIYLSGIATHPGAMLFAHALPAPMRERLREPGAVVVDPADLDTLNTEIGGRARINTHPVHVVGVVAGLRGLGGVNVLSSLETAREIAGSGASLESTYYVASLTPGTPNTLVRDRLMSQRQGMAPFEAWTAGEFARRSQNYWLLDTGAGAAVMFMAIIVCLVGAVVTSQALAGVVAGHAQEYATLNALGVSRGALARVVIEQALWIGGLGLLLAGGISAALLSLATAHYVPVAMTMPAALGCIGLIGCVALISGLAAVRRLMRTDPAVLLR